MGENVQYFNGLDNNNEKFDSCFILLTDEERKKKMSSSTTLLLSPPLGSTKPTTTTVSITTISPSDHSSTAWKNGLGFTTIIYTHHCHQSPLSKNRLDSEHSSSPAADSRSYPTNNPGDTTFNHQDAKFTFQLCFFTFLNAKNSLHLFPGYDVGMFQIPYEDNVAHSTSEERASSNSNPILPVHAYVQHDRELGDTLSDTTPHVYDGNLPTHISVSDSSLLPLKVLTWIASKSECTSAMSVERFEFAQTDKTNPDDVDQDSKASSEREGEMENEVDAWASRKVMMSHVLILHVVHGKVEIQIQDQNRIAKAGETLVIKNEFGGSVVPIDVSFKPFSPSPAAKTVLLVIHVNLIPVSRSVSSLVENLPPAGRGVTKSSSIYMYDDQPQPPPLWSIPRKSSISTLSQGQSMSNLFQGGAPVVKYWGVQHFSAPRLTDSELNLPPPGVVDNIIIENYEKGRMTTVWLNIMKQGMGEWIRLPVIIARGNKDGPVVGLTAVIHGNELNGVPCIHKVMSDIDANKLAGTVIALPCVNVPGYLAFSRLFSDGKDLNRCFPGSESGTSSSIFNFNLMTKCISKLNYILDLHTASFGRVNSYYVRADLNDPVCAIMAKLLTPQIILHNSGQDGTMRSAAMALGIKCITVEIGNPQQFQNQYIEWSSLGVLRILNHLGMTPSITELPHHLPSTHVCSKGFWMYTTTGGVLEVYPTVNSIVKKGDLIARVKNIFGNVVAQIKSDASGIVIGRSSNPVAMAGDRVIHLGVIRKEGESLPLEAKENY